MRKTLLAAVLPLTLSCTAFGQTDSAEFEAASIKPVSLSNPNNGERIRRESITTDPGSLIMRNVSLKSAIQWAYNVQAFQVSGPGWLGDERYDIVAKAASNASDPELRKMLQILLNGGFKMTVHRDTKEMQAYALIVGKNGPKMTPGDPNGRMRVSEDGTKGMFTDVSMNDIVDLLNRAVPQFNIDQPVIDQTGLKGRYNFSLDVSSFIQTVSAAIGPGQRPDPDVLINAVQNVLQSQLGLKAESRKAPVDLIVVDRADKIPAEN